MIQVPPGSNSTLVIRMACLFLQPTFFMEETEENWGGGGVRALPA